MSEHPDGKTAQAPGQAADLAAAEGWLRGLVEQTLAGIYLIQDGCFRYVNQGFADIFGYASPAELIDKVKISQLIAPEDQQKVADNVRRRTDGEVRDMRYTFVGLRQDGARIELEVHGRTMEYKGRPAVIGLILDITERREAEAARLSEAALLIDITERKRLEGEMAKRIEELKTLNDRLEEAHSQLMQAEKMSAVGQLAAGIAHEINNPVGFVNSNLGTLKDYLGGLIEVIDAYRLVAEACPPQHPAVLRADQLCRQLDLDFVRNDAMALLGESRDGLERVKRIVADLKDFSRVGESKWQAADLHQCLDSTLNVVANEVKYKADVVKEYGVLPQIMCMPFQLNQVFMNLLVNAAHAIKEHGLITLRTGCEADTVWIEVEDNGAGIRPENLQRIFEPFFTTKPVGAGTGLGLSVSYGIVQKHQGRIEVRSEPGKGTVFRVILPIDPQSPDDAADDAPDAVPPAPTAG